MSLLPISILVISFSGVIFLGYFFYVLFSESRNIKRFVKIFLIFFSACLLLVLLTWYVDEKEEPESFKEAVEITTNKHELLSKIGTYYSYSYKQTEWPKKTDNPANIKIELNGSRASMYLTCIMHKDTSGKWAMKSLKAHL